MRGQILECMPTVDWFKIVKINIDPYTFADCLPFAGRKRRTGREKYSAILRVAVRAIAACILLFSSAKNGMYTHRIEENGK